MTMACHGVVLSQIFPAGKTWGFPAAWECLLLLCSCPFTCFHCSQDAMIPTQIDDGVMAQQRMRICPRNSFFCGHCLHPAQSHSILMCQGKEEISLVSNDCQLSVHHIFKTSESGCSLNSCLLLSHQTGKLFQSSSRNWAETAILMFFCCQLFYPELTSFI